MVDSAIRCILLVWATVLERLVACQDRVIIVITPRLGAWSSGRCRTKAAGYIAA
jgi:hypothetical protein